MMLHSATENVWYVNSLNSQGTPDSGGLPHIWGNLKNPILGNTPDMGKWQISFSLFERERTPCMNYNYSWTLPDHLGNS